MKSLLPLTLVLLVLVLPGRVVAVDNFFDLNGVKIRYVVAGKGDPVILIHGWMGDSGMWGQDRDGKSTLDPNPATKEFQLIALDLRGHGLSDKPHDPAKYGAEMASDVVRLMDHLKLPKAHLVGYSMGAFVAAKVAATHPDRVLSVVYGGQAPIIIVPGKVMAPADEIEVFAKAVDEGKDLGAYIIATFPPGKTKPSAEQATAIANILYKGKDVKAFAAAGRSFTSLGVTEDELKKCKAPIFFIHGSDESDSTKDRVVAVLKLLGRGEHKVITGGSHITTLTKPEFGSTILEFLRTNKQR